MSEYLSMKTAMMTGAFTREQLLQLTQSGSTNTGSAGKKDNLITFASFQFYAKPGQVLGARDLTVQASSETEDKNAGAQNYVSRKAANATQITLTAVLDERMGIAAQSTAVKMLNAARSGTTGYFYIRGNKLFPAQFMLTEAKADNIVFTPSGKWLCCEVALTLKQCGQQSGSVSAAGRSSAGKGGGNSGKTPTLAEIYQSSQAFKEQQAVTAQVTLAAAKKQSLSITQSLFQGVAGKEESLTDRILPNVMR